MQVFRVNECYEIRWEVWTSEVLSDSSIILRTERSTPPTRKYHLPRELFENSYLYIVCQLCPLISIYISLRGNLSDPLLSRISTWKISNLHVEVFYFPRGREIKLRRNEMKLRRKRMKLRRNFFFLTWVFRNIHVEITFPRHSSVLICSRL